MLTGGSSTGKTRACWEALRHLPDGWRVWHPFDPTRPEAALAAIEQLAPHTVVWLNEAQHYLLTTSDLGERLAAKLRTLLADPGRAPVLVLGTVWPEYWRTLTLQPEPGCEDPHAQSRALLAGHDLPVPLAFSETDLRALARRAGRIRAWLTPPPTPRTAPSLSTWQGLRLSWSDTAPHQTAHGRWSRPPWTPAASAMAPPFHWPCSNQPLRATSATEVCP